MDLDPFFSDDEGEDDTMGSSAGGMMNVEGGGRDRGERGSSLGPLGVSIWDSKAEYLKTKRLAEPYFPKSTIHMVSASTSANSSARSSVMAGSGGSSERQDEETTVASLSSSSIPSTINGSVSVPVSVPVKPRDVELHWAQAIAEACQCPELTVRPGMPIPGQSFVCSPFPTFNTVPLPNPVPIPSSLCPFPCIAFSHFPMCQSIFTFF